MKEMISLHSPGFDALLFWAYEFLAAFLPFLAFFCFRIRKQENRPSPFSRVSVLVFVFYIIALYHFTGAGTLYDGMRYRFSLPDQLNLIPFSNTIDPVGYLLNVVLFLPLGLLVPLLWDRMGQFRSVLGSGAALSLFIELTQILNNRATDIDDLIMNLIGTAAGFIVYKVFDRRTESRFQRRDIPLSMLAASILLPYLGRFFLYHDMGLAKLLYGF